MKRFSLTTEKLYSFASSRPTNGLILPAFRRLWLGNPLITNALHASTVGAGFIPVLPATDKNQGKRPAAARMGINPTPTRAECCKGLSISGLHRVFCDWCHPRTTGKYIVPVLIIANAEIRSSDRICIFICLFEATGRPLT